MGTLFSLCRHKRYIIFLNISFLSLVCLFLITQFDSVEFHVLSSYRRFNKTGEQDCKRFQSLDDYQAKCLYLKSNNPCVFQGYFDYLHLFYCNFGRFPLLAHCFLFLWLLVLFYLLGNTASEYFCSSLENLSNLLKLSPRMAGITLLSLGNGAPDVFASLVSFMDGGTSDIGFDIVFGGASFVTCVVVGIISILVKEKQVRVNKGAFIRDVSFFLLVLISLIFTVLHGRINLWGALGFLLMYIVYVSVVYISNKCLNKNENDSQRDGNSSCSYLSVPILSKLEKEAVSIMEEGSLEDDTEGKMKEFCFCSRISHPCRILLCILEMPLYLPRRLTIPVVCEKRWSKPIAVASVTFAPLLLSVLWNARDEDATFYSNLPGYGVGLFFGTTFGVLAFLKTEKSSPPTKWLFPWLAGGFLMSMTWSYVTAQELVALLVSLGYIFGISPSTLGLTVLAWGNSLGDLVTNSTLALNGSPEGSQVAISGCYAGPIFNVLFGLGLSLVCSSLYNYGSSVVIPGDAYLLETLGFLVGGLLWALVVLPRRNMKLDGILGGGLLAVYLMSLCLRLFPTVGSFQFITHIS